MNSPRPYSSYVLSLRTHKLYSPAQSLHGTKIMRVDRMTRFGNPFIVGVHGVRGECCRKHSTWLDTGGNFGNPKATEELRQWVLNNVHTLRGAKLLCWCAPSLCHAEKLAELANRRDNERPSAATGTHESEEPTR